MRKSLLMIGLLASTPAWAGDKPIVQQVPDWVLPAPATPPNTPGDSPLVVLDSQNRIDGSRSWMYLDREVHISSPQMLSQFGTIKIAWQPAHGDLLIHRVELIRDGTTVDLMKTGAGFTVLRREEGLDQRALDGMLTATMPVEGMRVGDVFRLSYSITKADPVLKGNVQIASGLIAQPVKIGVARYRLLWPAGQHIAWQALATGVAAQPTSHDGLRDLIITMPLAKQPEMPADAPVRYRHPPLIEASSFADWAAVSKVMAPLYATDGLIAPGSPLAAEVSRIAAATSDPLQRTALALQLVQEKVRYQLIAMDSGNYVPQTPTATWASRYGDCKAKTLLLLALLHALKVDAEPVLANITLGDLVHDRLPSAAAFDHVLVRATVGGAHVWLDGTAQGARLADLHDTPPFRWVLPVRDAGATIEPIAMHPVARPTIDAVLDLDMSQGRTLPAPFHLVTTMRGGLAEVIRTTSAAATKEQMETLGRGLAAPLVPNAIVTGETVRYDEATGTARFEVDGLARMAWRREKADRFALALQDPVAKITLTADRTRPAWQAIPIVTANPGFSSVAQRIVLPAAGAGYTIGGDPSVATTAAGVSVTRKAVLSGTAVSVTATQQSDGREISAADAPAERAKLAALKATPLQLLAPADAPPPWREAADAVKAGRVARLAAAYDIVIANKPEDAERYISKAGFLDSMFDRRGSIAALSKAITLAADARSYLLRSREYEAVGDQAKALADAQAALDLDPGKRQSVERVVYLKGRAGDYDGALALLAAKIELGGDEKPAYLSERAYLEAKRGDVPTALATSNAALEEDANNPNTLNARCWLRGTMNVELDVALKDCTKAIELSSAPVQALDSRALVFLRIGRLNESLADLDQVLRREPNKAGSLYLRSIVRSRSGNVKGADEDLTGARLLWPPIEAEYGAWDLKR